MWIGKKYGGWSLRLSLWGHASYYQLSYGFIMLGFWDGLGLWRITLRSLINPSDFYCKLDAFALSYVDFARR